MGHQRKRLGLSVAIAAVGVVAVGCSAGGSTTPTSPTAPTTVDTPTLHVDAGGVLVNDTEVPAGETRPVQLDQPIVVGEKGHGTLRVGDVEFELLEKTAMRVDSWDRPEVRSSLDYGQLVVKLASNSDARVRLETSNDVVLKTLQDGTEFTVCQTPQDFQPKPVLCVRVREGEVEWQSKGQTIVYPKGKGTFAFKGTDPDAARCLTADGYNDWYQKAQRAETTDALGDVVGRAPYCDPSAVTTASSNETLPSPPTVPTTQRSSSGTRPRPPPQGTPPQGTPPPGTPPHETAPHDTAPHDTAPHDTAPHDTPPHDTPPHDTPPHDTPPHDTAPQDTAPLGT